MHGKSLEQLMREHGRQSAPKYVAIHAIRKKVFALGIMPLQTVGICFVSVTSSTA